MHRRNWIGGLLLTFGMAIAAATSYIGPTRPALGEHSLGTGNNSEEGISCYFLSRWRLALTPWWMRLACRAQHSHAGPTPSQSTPIAKALVEARNRGVESPRFSTRANAPSNTRPPTSSFTRASPRTSDDKHAIRPQ